MTDFAATPPAPQGLDDWAPKRSLSLDAARAHSRRVRVFQTVLLVVALGLVAALVYQFVSRSPSEIFDEPVDETVRMVNPRYVGRTSDDLPYTLTADFANRVREAPNRLNLDNPLLNFYREQGAQASTIDALQGTYNDLDEILELRTDVVLTTDDGNQCFTTHARIFLEVKTVEGDEPIRCTGDFGVLEGNSYEIRDDYRVFVFKEGMTGLLESSSIDGEAAGIAQRDNG